jgi:hypothetical protein
MRREVQATQSAQAKSKKVTGDAYLKYNCIRHVLPQVLEAHAVVSVITP